MVFSASYLSSLWYHRPSLMKNTGVCLRYIWLEHPGTISMLVYNPHEDPLTIDTTHVNPCKLYIIIYIYKL
jgi:hypothetical protein